MTRMLRIKGQMISLTHSMDVLNEQDQVIYRVKSDLISVTDKTHIKDAAGNPVAEIHTKPLSVHNVYTMTMASGQTFQLSSELFRLNDVVDIPELNWQLKGDVFDFDFEVIDLTSGRILAEANREMVSLHGAYDLEIIDDADTELLVAVFVVLKHLIDRRVTSEAMDKSSPAQH